MCEGTKGKSKATRRKRDLVELRHQVSSRSSTAAPVTTVQYTNPFYKPGLRWRRQLARRLSQRNVPQALTEKFVVHAGSDESIFIFGVWYWMLRIKFELVLLAEER
jgi:hypothetical protein